MTKLQIAYHQLKRAFLLFAHEKDYLSALTLAGAADEILGKLAIKSNPEATIALDDEVALIISIMRKFGEAPSEKEIRDFLLYPRNAAKHLSVGIREDVAFDIREEAESL